MSHQVGRYTLQKFKNKQLVYKQPPPRHNKRISKEDGDLLLTFWKTLVNLIKGS